MTQYDPEARIWSARPRPPVLNPRASVGQVLLNVLERTPTKVAQINADTNVWLTCDDLRRRAIRFALFLQDHLSNAPADGGDPVVLIARNSDNVAPVAIGCFLAGIPIGTLDPAFSSEEIRNMLGIMRPRAMITDRQTLPSVRAAVGDTFAGLLLEFDKVGVLQMTDHEPADPQCYCIDTLLGGKVSKLEDAYVPPYLGDSERRTAAIVCSSGTTGMPKAVRISHAQLIAPYQRISQLDRDDTILCFSTLYWISGLQMLMTGVLNGIRRIITSEPTSPGLAIELCQRYDVTVLLVTPTLAADMIRMLENGGDRLRSLKLFAVGGSPVPITLRAAINQQAVVSGRGRCFVGYGMSEAGPVAYEYVPRADSVGFLTPGVKAKIVDAEGRLLGPNEPGELLVRPAHPFLGYHRDPVATAGALDQDGYVRTGDIARFDTDGFLFLVERMKEIFKVGGRQVAPAELESIIGEMPGVRLVAVVGVPDPAAPFDDLAMALIVRAEGPAGDALSKQSVLDHLEKSVSAEHKRLRGGVFFVGQLPMTANGKVKRSSAKDIAVEMYANSFRIYD
ncbi:long-chain-fatty-acid--CoA ligase-like [Anopheles ziemanni]|uniref:long-chain-fatty-acid--CoA ligase-like n=1 Tax=Anopheles coustani TaxID=139045 RepID=UPI00265AE67E|nr:long-chain-fatty-acid--CoA ligase-like [Anopheles coustani]XP_058176348.1 long-chain-fatty-acid--CoA ligase-like [Anopheles ziemanni]